MQDDCSSPFILTVTTSGFHWRDFKKVTESVCKNQAFRNETQTCDKCDSVVLFDQANSKRDLRIHVGYMRLDNLQLACVQPPTSLQMDMT